MLHLLRSLYYLLVYNNKVTLLYNIKNHNKQYEYWLKIKNKPNIILGFIRFYNLHAQSASSHLGSNEERVQRRRAYMCKICECVCLVFTKWKYYIILLQKHMGRKMRSIYMMHRALMLCCKV